MTKKLFAFVMAFMAVTGMTTLLSCGEMDNAVLHMWKITITGDAVKGDKATMKVDETMKLGLDIVPSNANVTDPVWLSGDESIATVDADGLVTALAVGVTTINVHSAYNPEVKNSIGLEVISKVVELDGQTANYTAKDGDELKGTTTFTVIIPDGVKVTLGGVNIAGADGNGILCKGDATIILKKGTKSTVKSTRNLCAGIMAGVKGKTLTIDGTGTLNAEGGKNAAAIGGDASSACGNIVILDGTITAIGDEYAAAIGCGSTEGFEAASCGNITISGGTITATGGENGAGIGSGDAYWDNNICGNITINGGTVTATGGKNSAGIGTGYGDYNKSACGAITITTGVTQVTAVAGTTGTGTPHSIGTGVAYGDGGATEVGAVIIGGGVVGEISITPYTYKP